MESINEYDVGMSKRVTCILVWMWGILVFSTHLPSLISHKHISLCVKKKNIRSTVNNTSTNRSNLKLRKSKTSLKNFDKQNIIQNYKENLPWKVKCTYPFSEALTMYGVSAFSLPSAKQLMAAVWPNNMLRG